MTVIALTIAAIIVGSIVVGKSIMFVVERVWPR